MYCLKTKLFRKCHDSNDFSDFDKFYKLNEYIKTNVIEENVQDKSKSSLKYETQATSSIATDNSLDPKSSDYPSHIGSSGFRIDINKMGEGNEKTDLNE